jgi:hypothetical protein
LKKGSKLLSKPEKLRSLGFVKFAKLGMLALPS